MTANDRPASTTKVGIDDMALYVPSLYFDIKTLAEWRELPYAKLEKGLGLYKMAIPDAHEDAATMSANAIVELIERNGINPAKIGRIYLGTESALDAAKPTATYALDMLCQKYGETAFRHCDVVDLTFACIGGVDALHNTLDWIRATDEENPIGIVVCADNARYDLGSTGEYTQGAGAVAMLVKKNPRLLAVENLWGVSTQSVHDFYKPLRRHTKKSLIEQVYALAGINGPDANTLMSEAATVNGTPIFGNEDVAVHLHSETPVFDGQFSNACYQNRVEEAFEHFKQKAVKKGIFDAGKGSLLDQWERIICHLPYAFHAKRVLGGVFWNEYAENDAVDLKNELAGLSAPQPEGFEDKAAYEKARSMFLRSITKTESYRKFVNEKLEKAQRASGQVGNMYAASLFLALMSTLESDFADDVALKNKRFGFMGYGSGSKAKVFEAQVQPRWREVVGNFNLFDKLAQRQAIDYPTYHKLHTGKAKQSVETPAAEFALSDIGTEGTTLGARYYAWYG